MSDTPQETRPSFGAARFAEETRERFVREIVARVPLARLVELHLFAPMRQGGMESGVAVLAASLEVPEAESVAEPTVPAAPLATSLDEPLPVEPAREVAVEVAVEEALEDAEAGAERCDPTDAAAGPASEGAEQDGEAGDEVHVDATAPVDARDVAAFVAEPIAPAAPVAASAGPRRRHTVFTARYRLVLKGPERGRWDVEVREEADAPLVTVEAVVRGVQARSGDAIDSERLDAATVARLLGVPEGG